MKYPILGEIARSLLAIPVSTVASESAFSTGGRVLDSFRSSLAPATVEALICTQNWIKGTPIHVPDVLEYEEADVEEEGDDQSGSGIYSNFLFSNFSSHLYISSNYVFSKLDHACAEVTCPN